MEHSRKPVFSPGGCSILDLVAISSTSVITILPRVVGEPCGVQAPASATKIEDKIDSNH